MEDTTNQEAIYNLTATAKRPSTTLQPVETTVFDGGSVTFTCHAHDEFDSANKCFQWTLNDTLETCERKF